MIKAETGDPRSIEEIAAEVQVAIDTWKQVSYRDAWNFLVSCQESVVNPGYLINAFGRYRRFAKSKERDVISSMKREAGNFPIQSFVSDACMLAMLRMDEYRSKNNLHFKFMNQVHDAVMTYVPIEEVEAMKKCYKETMGAIEVPVAKGRILTLGVDIEVMTRWSEKVKSVTK